jgi:hypothetical protein
MMDGWQSLGIKTSVHDQIRQIADRENTAMSNVVRRAIDLYVAASDTAAADAEVALK